MTEQDRPAPERPANPARVSSDVMAVLPLRDIVVFPHMIVPLFVGREKSVRALEAVMKDDKQILLVAQKNASQDDPTIEDIYRVGTVSTILQLLKLPDGTVKVLVEGGRRARITGFKETNAFFEAQTEPMADVVGEKNAQHVVVAVGSGLSTVRDLLGQHGVELTAPLRESVPRSHAERGAS